MIDERLLRSEERVVLTLRDLYRRHGYACFKMSKFEEYDLYGQNKDFLVSDSVITFTDTDGKLMALKPDVTLSIVKNHRDGTEQRVYYDENVYRISKSTHNYRELLQTGLEAMGRLSEFDLTEVAELAAQSLAAVSPDAVLTLSDLGVLNAALAPVESGEQRAALLGCLQRKNAHGISELCRTFGLGTGIGERLALLAQSGTTEIPDALWRQFADGPAAEALTRLERIAERVRKSTPVRITFDFSLVSDMNYYNGIVFRGYLRGIPAPVLRGGQYDKLMQKLGKSDGAIGFAVYLDLLERLTETDPYDADVLLLYAPDAPVEAVRAEAEALRAAGKSVCARVNEPEGMRFREILRAEGGGKND